MNIAIAAGGRFHAFQLANQLAQRNSLKKLFTFYYTKKDRTLVPENLVSNNSWCQFIDTCFCKLRLARVINPSTFNNIKDNFFDFCMSKEIPNLGKLDLFVGWANYTLYSMPAIRKTGAKIIIESGSCHILAQMRILQQEYAKHGLMFPPINQRVIDKMMAEYEQADYIMTLSSFARQSFIDQGIKAEKVLCVPCGMDVSYFAAQPQKKDPSNFRVIFVGLAGVRKGVHYLIEAWASLDLPARSTELLIVGNVQKDLKQVLAGMKIPANVNFFGSTTRETLRNLYHSSDLFVLPSLEDGFGMVIGEAMAAGLPVVCTTSTGAPDIITHGKEGFLVPPANSTALAEKILELYQNAEMRCAMGRAGQETIQHFTWDIYGTRIYDVYKTLV
ncbi:glycosyltransferase family 4 protein [Candidatus Babeliales bacterium]|nr:glycosyltransferase family 4 protein [Candidatus Babeliales bacterium]